MDRIPQPASGRSLEPLVREQVAAELLDWKRETLQADRLRNPPRIPFYRLGRSVRYSLDDVRDFLQRHKVGARR